MDTSCLWDVLETTSLDETTAFAHNHSHPIGSLYQVETCIKVTPRSGSTHIGRVVLCSSSDTIVIAVDQQLMLFGASDRQLVSTLNFDSAVDCVTCNDGGSLLVVGERFGDIHAIIAKTGKLLASRHLDITKAYCDTPLIKAVEFGRDPLGRLAVLTSDGRLHVIDGIQTGKLKHDAIDVNDASCLTITCNGDIIICNTDNSLNLWSGDDAGFTITGSCQMLSGPAVKCAVLPCSNSVLVLDSSSCLVKWNMDRLVAVGMLGYAGVVDFVLVDRPGVSHGCSSTIAALQKSEISNCINIYSLPQPKPIFSIDVHQDSLLFPSSVLNDSVYLLERWSENTSSRLYDNTSGWQIRRLAETDPQTRLRCLLAKQRFSEAESFAEKFDLDVQFVYRECISHLMVKLSASADDADNAGELISQLMKCLSRLNDIPYVVKCSITSALPDLEATNQLLNLAYNRLEKSSCLSAEVTASLNTRLLETSRRLSAFQVTIFCLCYRSYSYCYYCSHCHLILCFK